MDLPGQSLHRFAAPLAEALESKAPTSRIYRYSAEQVPELTCTASIERTVGPIGQSCNLSKTLTGTNVAPFMEYEGR